MRSGVSDLDLYADLLLRKLVTSDGGAVSVPVLVLGDQCVATLRLLEHGEGDVLRETNLNVRTLRASIGNVLAPPTDGSFTLRFEGDRSGDLKPSSTAAEVKAALDALDPEDAHQLQEVVASSVPGCWLLRFASAAAIPLAVASNTLKPESFVRIRTFEQSGQRWHEIRLVQTPAVFTGTHERVLPPPPNVTRIRDGNTQGDFKTNEIQALIVPANFRGTYYLRWDFRTTKLLGIDDGPQEIAAALNAMFTDGGTRFDVSNPEPDHAYVEFIGELEGAPQPLMEVSVHSFEPGVLTFTLDLARAELASALREVPQIELPFEVEIEVVDDDQDAADPAIPGRLITLFQQPIKIAREQIWEELADIPAIDWMQPPQPRDYIPFTRDQVLIGNQATYIAALGDGAKRSFSLSHNRGTSNGVLSIRENIANGRLLRPDECTVHFPSDNELVVDFPAPLEAPALNAYVLNFTAAGPASAFQNHTHTIQQIIGLEDALFALGARLASIEDLLPQVQPAAPRTDLKPMEISIPDKAEIFPGRLSASIDAKSLASGTLPTPLPRAAGLLPAIHDATVLSIPVPLPSPATNAGQVFRNDTNAALSVPAGLGRRGTSLEPGGFIGSDGRVWYRLTQHQATNSYFPTDFERELFLFAVNEQMLRAGQSLSLEFDIALQLLQANTRGQYLLVIEVGGVPGQLTPAPTAENLLDVTWQPVPLLSQRIIVFSFPLKHHFGASIRREINGTLLADRLLYSAWEAGAAAPASPNFVIRARLVQWDTENSVRDAKGNVFYSLTGAKAQIQ